LGGFFTSGPLILTTQAQPSTRTAVYVDGYNLYYGRLRGTDFKWLDLVKLIEDRLQQRTQNEKLLFVHLFTAPALASFATHGQASTEAQSAYIRALQTKYPDQFKVTYGKHTYDRSGSLLASFVPGQPFDRSVQTRVWLLEEKKTDVNLAITMYRDVAKGVCDRIILISNDSDAEPALEAIRKDFPNVMVGVITPLHDKTRSVSASLSRNADWVISKITDTELGNAQLPASIPTRKKPIKKPTYW